MDREGGERQGDIARENSMRKMASQRDQTPQEQLEQALACCCLQSGSTYVVPFVTRKWRIVKSLISAALSLESTRCHY